MHFCLVLLLLFELLATVHAKGGRGGGGRGSSGARSSAGRSSGGRSGGSHSGGRSHSTHGSSSYWYSSSSYRSSGRSSGGSYYYYSSSAQSYYDKYSPKASCENFKRSFSAIFMNATSNGTIPVKQSATTPIVLNKNKYFFDRNQLTTSNNKRCAARISELLTDTVPFETSIGFLNQAPAPIDTTENLTITYSSATAFFEAIYENGQKATEIVWSCEESDEICCYMECCVFGESLTFWEIFVYVIFGLLIGYYCVFVCTKLAKYWGCCESDYSAVSTN